MDDQAFSSIETEVATLLADEHSWEAPKEAERRLLVRIRCPTYTWVAEQKPTYPPKEVIVIHGDDSESSDDNYDPRHPNSCDNSFGRKYKERAHEARNPTPPPTGYQKRKEFLHYSEGPKGFFRKPLEPREDRNKRHRKY